MDYSAEERAAWDQYFCAALIGIETRNASTKTAAAGKPAGMAYFSASREQIVAGAAETADTMLVERRSRLNPAL